MKKWWIAFLGEKFRIVWICVKRFDCDQKENFETSPVYKGRLETRKAVEARKEELIIAAVFILSWLQKCYTAPLVEL